MFTPEARGLIRDMLQLFSQASRIPLELYEINEDGTVAPPPIRADEALFPEHCRAVWALDGGRGKDVCNQDMCRRAQDAATSGQDMAYMCHAGLDNQTQVIEMEGRTVAVIQYGAFRLVNEARWSEIERRNRHKEAMLALGASDAEAARIRYLLLGETTSRTSAEWEVYDEALMPLLSAVIVKYAVQVAQEKRTRARAYHDLQLRLASALALAENLSENIKDGSVSDPAHDVDDVVGAITAASSVMHSLTRGEYLPRTYRWRTHQIRTFVENAILLCRPEADKKGIELRVDLQPFGGRYTIEASGRHLEQVFNNLIQNAVKYSYRSSQAAHTLRYVSIRGRIVNDGYEVVIGNFGVGIERDEYEAVFAEGYRGRLTEAEYRTGSGLGLSLTDKIVREHGGHISVESEPLGDTLVSGRRPYHTRFTLWLPLSQEGRRAPRKGRRP